MTRGRAVSLDRVVRREAVRLVPTQGERGLGDQQLRVTGVGDVGCEHGALPGEDAGEQVAAYAEVDRTPVVGVDEGLLPELAALVHVGDPRHRQRDRLRRHGVAPARPRDLREQLVEDRRHRGIVEGRVDRRVHRALVRRVGRGPRRAVTGLAHRLLGVRVQTLSRRRPGAEDRLPEQVAEGGVGEGDERQQPVQGVRPPVRDLREHADAGADVLASLRVVRRRRRHRIRARCLTLRHRRVELLDGDRPLARVAPDLGQRREPGRAVEGAVLDALRHHRTGRLLEAQRGRLLRVAEHRLQVVERRDQVGTSPARVGERRTEGWSALGQVRAVHREAGRQLGERIDEEVVRGVVSRRSQSSLLNHRHSGGRGRRASACLETTGRHHLARDAADLGAQDAVGDGPLGVVDQLVEVERRPAQTRLQRGQAEPVHRGR